MAPLTDVTFAPIRLDQITVPFFSNGFCLSSRSSQGAIAVNSRGAFILGHKAAFYYHWKDR